eukprot:364560-Chlamydomonas_euryale.AAC.3
MQPHPLFLNADNVLVANTLQYQSQLCKPVEVGAFTAAPSCVDFHTHVVRRPLHTWQAAASRRVQLGVRAAGARHLRPRQCGRRPSGSHTDVSHAICAAGK